MTREKKFGSVAKSSAIAVLEDELKIRSNVYAEYIAHGGKADCGEEFYLDALKMAIAALKEQSKVVESDQFKWISVKDRLIHLNWSDSTTLDCSFSAAIAIFSASR